MVALLMHECNK